VIKEVAAPDGGIHEWRGLLYGGYFVVEQTPPEGFLPDENAYYFEIRADGETVLIENGEPGKGFGNVADGGTGRIIKDSEDGRRYGFTFKIEGTVEGAAYSETFTTGADGIITVGLKPGSYTISEVKDASAGYILPEPATVEIRQGETAIIQFYNALPDEPETPDKPETPVPTTPNTPSTPAQPQKPVPQTGDSYMALVWAGLMAASLLAGVVALLLYRRWAGKHTRRRTVAAISVLLCLLLGLAGGGMVARELLQYQRDAGAYADLQRAALPGGEGAESVVAPDSLTTALAVDFDALAAINPDIAGWLECEGTAINYPVVQGQDNSRYLNTLFDGSKGKAGCLFIDYENSPGLQDQNTVIYGHNLLDGSMLSGIVQYGQQGYFDTHPAIRLHTPEGSYTVELFAGYTARVTDSAWMLAWEDAAGFTGWLETVRGKSAFESEVVVDADDRVLTLSTCTNGGKDRFVLHGRLVMDE
jgi:SrtB family sortase